MMKYLFSSTFDIPCSTVRYSLLKGRKGQVFHLDKFALILSMRKVGWVEWNGM